MTAPTKADDKPERLPITSVPAFALVARLLSIPRASGEVSVTLSAVSHQIGALEDYLAVQLFEREKTDSS